MIRCRFGASCALQVGHLIATARDESRLETRLRCVRSQAFGCYGLWPELRRLCQLADLSAVCNCSDLLHSVSSEKLVLFRLEGFSIRRCCVLRRHRLLEPLGFHIPQLRDFSALAYPAAGGWKPQGTPGVLVCSRIIARFQETQRCPAQSPQYQWPLARPCMPPPSASDRQLRCLLPSPS